ncbi:MAG: hypothetical protein E7047_02270 [Lentisphaerae bacterium]|nr:hypothetical protein [Lentisphaerota bacterium]
MNLLKECVITITKHPAECTLFFSKRKKFIPHFHQAIYGYRLLEKRGFISLKTVFSNDLNIPCDNVFYSQVNGKKIFYDLSDGIQNFEVAEFRDFLQQQNAVIFKRAYDEILFGSEPLFFPYGLNHLALYPFYMRAICKLFPNPHFCKIPIAERCWTMKKDVSSVQNPILYSTRLWDGWDELNENRIMLAYKIRKFFTNAIVGIVDSPLARKLCPDLILPHKITRRKNFIDLINSSAVCVTSTGLWNSAGWSLGEFVAAGKAILSEPLHFKVPGDFREGKNYLTFNSADDVLSKCEMLLKDPHKRMTMEMENRDYYSQYLQPEVLVMNTLKQCSCYL